LPPAAAACDRRRNRHDATVVVDVEIRPGERDDEPTSAAGNTAYATPRHAIAANIRRSSA
jgi:hypothetical protein